MENWIYHPTASIQLPANHNSISFVRSAKDTLRVKEIKYSLKKLNFSILKVSLDGNSVNENGLYTDLS